ncbi:MAG: hypothetical protein Q9185_001416 [Variospora sp. 1 TL-2023]
MTAPEQPAKEEVDELDALDALEKEASEFNKDAEIDRILKAFKLDAYAVLNLQPGIPETQIKLQYRKLSLLIHPDKTSNPLAPSAFDRLKKASSELQDAKQRAHLDECIADARMLLMRERKLTVDSPEVKEPDAAFLAAWRKKTIEVLVDAEARRRKQAKAQLQEEGREQRKVDEETEQRKRRREHEVKWEESRESRIGSWRDFQKGGEKGEGKGQSKKKKLKVLG